MALRRPLRRGLGFRLVFSSLVPIVVALTIPALAETTPLPAPAGGQAASPHTADEAVLRAQAGEYARAFSAGDVESLAAMWAEDATFTDEGGRVYRGRGAIRKQMAGFFEAGGKQPMEIQVESIAFPADDSAVELGVTRLTGAAPGTGSQRYTALHVKRDGKWQMVNVTESPCASPLPKGAGEYLKELSWLVGKWTVKGPEGTLHIRSDWTANGNMLRSDYELVSRDGTRTAQTQFVFWDPSRGAIGSWQHDDTGGVGSAVWERSGDTWTVHARSVQSDGRAARADYSIHRLGGDAFTWQSTGRRLNGLVLPDTVAIRAQRDKS